MISRLTSTDFGDARLFTQGVPHTIVDRDHGVNTPIVGKIIGAGPITKQPGTVAYRIVLIDKKDGFSVNEQYFPNYDLDNPDVSTSHLHRGDYFQPEQLADAYKRFGERLVEHSIYQVSVYHKLSVAV